MEISTGESALAAQFLSTPGGYSQDQIWWSRIVTGSDIYTMLQVDETARQTVDRAVVTKKALDRRYEREWRLIGRRGPHDSPLEMEEVVFGMRCDTPVKYAVVKALEKRPRRVRFY